ncbi:hypothetical protein ACTWJ9_03265 [Streptomyces sp. GDS52]|uniref:hypothetical protein n=1 Tax=Streptomyces sp. GDS52 TaxID=3406419 RepID=UPI003FD54C70
MLLGLPGRNGSARSLLPVDAKDKHYDRHGVSAADVHQPLTHATSYRSCPLASAVTVHPRSGGRAHRSLGISGPQGMFSTIRVLGIDTATHPERAVARIGNTLLRVDRRSSDTPAVLRFPP